MATRPLYVICVFNIYSDFPDTDFPEETAEQRQERSQTYHYFGFSAQEAKEFAEVRFRSSCDHNWWEPVLLGEFPTNRREDGHEVVDVTSLTCPHCGRTF